MTNVGVNKSEKEISKEFYEIFHQTRLMLIRAFQEKKGVGEKEALYYAQRFMERAIFLFFALDNELINNQKLFSDTIFERLKKQECTDESKYIWNDINYLFEALDQGDLQLDIHGFGGGLFSPSLPEKIYFLDFQTKIFFANEIMISKIRKEPKLEGENLETWNEFGKDVSPIIKNLLIMDSYNFKNTLNVTILGHILEQSLDDLNEFQKTGNVKRKIDGVFYTPHTLTDHICRNTIIPYLSKNNVNTVAELISEYQDNLEGLEKKMSQIKIIDPACGSGAFLINAAQILLEISESIQMKKGKSQVSSGTLDTWQKEIETSKIIENNIFGVDISRDSVEITKLSLFLIMAKPGEKLTNLSDNIIRGNSVIDDKVIDPYGNVWEDKFSEIINSGGFDVVIGNPPWQIIKPDVDEFFSPLKETQLLLATKYHNTRKLFSKIPVNQKKILIEECLLQTDIQTSYKKYLQDYKVQLDFFKSSKNYTLQGKGDFNLYKLFLEKSIQIVHTDSIIGLIIPSGFCSDLGTKELRQTILDNNSVLGLCGFINSKPIFHDVHRQYKFCSVIFKTGNKTKKFPSRFFVVDDNTLQNFHKIAINYDLNFLRQFSPMYYTILEYRNKIELQIYKKLFKYPTLLSPAWNIKVTQELHMTNDSKYFERSEIGPPLYEGKMIHMFTHTYALPTRWLDEAQIREKFEKKTFKKIPISIRKKHYKTSLRIHADEYRLVWRIQSDSTNTRSLISTILPPNVFLGNNLGYFIPIVFDKTKFVKPISNIEYLFLCGMLNSFPQDFLMRHKTVRNINNFHIRELPFPRFDKTNSIHKKILKNSSMLICTTDEYAKLRDEVGISEYTTEPEKRLLLEAQINAAVAKIYDLTKEEFEYVLESFPSADKNLKETTMREFLLL